MQDYGTDRVSNFCTLTFSKYSVAIIWQWLTISYKEEYIHVPYKKERKKKQQYGLNHVLNNMFAINLLTFFRTCCIRIHCNNKHINVVTQHICKQAWIVRLNKYQIDAGFLLPIMPDHNLITVSSTSGCLEVAERQWARCNLLSSLLWAENSSIKLQLVINSQFY